MARADDRPADITGRRRGEDGSGQCRERLPAVHIALSLRLARAVGNKLLGVSVRRGYAFT